MNFRRAPHDKLTPQLWAVRLVWRNREDTGRVTAIEKAEGTKGKVISISCRRANDVVCSRVQLICRKEISNANTIPSADKTISKNSRKGLERFSKTRRGMYRAGPLDTRSRRLVKIGIAAGSGSEGAMHSDVRNALAEGISPDEIRHAILLSITTIGFPNGQAALSWAENIMRRK